MTRQLCEGQKIYINNQLIISKCIRPSREYGMNIGVFVGDSKYPITELHASGPTIPSDLLA